MIKKDSGLFFLSSVSSPESFHTTLIGAFSVDEKYLVSGDAGLEEYKAIKGFYPKVEELGVGRYLYLFSSPRGLYISGDYSGSELVFRYKNGDDWALSNSLIYLADKVRQMGWPLSLNETSLATFFLKGSIGKQLLTRKTGYSEIELVPRSYNILVFSKDGKNYFKEELKKSKYDGFGYYDLMRSWYKDWSSIIYSLSQYAGEKGEKVRLDLSGGVDTRVSFSLCSGFGFENIRIFSQPHKPSDLNVVDELSKEYGFSYDTKFPPFGRLHSSAQYYFYRYGCVGIYNNATTPPMFDVPSSEVVVNGAGGGNIRAFFSGSAKSWSKKIESLLPNELHYLSNSIYEDFIEEMEELDVDIKDKTSMVHHYRNYRSRIHAGRNWYESLKFSYWSPLLDERLEKAFDKLSLEDKVNRKIYADMIILGGGTKLLFKSYDDPRKAFNNDIVEHCEFDVSGEVFSIDSPYSVLGFKRVIECDRDCKPKNHFKAKIENEFFFERTLSNPKAFSKGFREFLESHVKHPEDAGFNKVLSFNSVFSLANI